MSISFRASNDFVLCISKGEKFRAKSEMSTILLADRCQRSKKYTSIALPLQFFSLDNVLLFISDGQSTPLRVFWMSGGDHPHAHVHIGVAYR